MNTENLLRQQGILIEYAKRRTAWNMPALHSHDHYEIYYLLKGARTYFIDSRQYSVQEGDVVLLSKKVLHKTTVRDSAVHSRLALYFTDEYIPPALKADVLNLFSCRVLTPDRSTSERIKTLFFALLEAQQKQANYREELLKCRLFELLLCFVETAPQPKAADDFVSCAITFLKEHLSEPITLSSAAKHLSYSPSHFSRKFKAETGVGFHEYLTKLRIQQGAVLLEETDLPITKIAECCGFEDSNYFSSVFHRVYGASPRNYRQSTLHPNAGKLT